MAKKLPYWISTVLFALMMTPSALMTVTRQPPLVAAYTHLGYPLYFMTILGAAKAIGIVVLLAPGLKRLKEWAYAGFVVNLVSAAASHLASGDPPSSAVLPLVLLGAVLTSWWTRPESRKLDGAAL
jgi:hypothetical protein